MRRIHLPPRLRAESHDMSAANTLPRCMRPVGDGAKRPITLLISFVVFYNSYSVGSLRSHNFFCVLRDKPLPHRL